MSGIGNKIFTTFLILLLGGVLMAQPKDNAPYSRLGLGDILPPSFASTIAFGSLNATYQDPYNVNLQNPASLGFLRAATFEVGLYAKYAKLKLNDLSSEIWSGNLQYLSLGFPVKNPLNELLDRKISPLKWTMNIALMPYTTIGYDIFTEEVHPLVDTTENVFQGTGGTNKLLWSHGFLYKNMSFGFTLGYLFGNLENSRQVHFSSLDASYDDIFEDKISLNGFVWNAGFQYRISLDKKKKGEKPTISKKSVIVGVYGNSANNFSTYSSRLRTRFNGSYVIDGIDTVAHEVNIKEKGKLPAEFGFGLMYHNLDKMRLGIDYQFGNWSNYENEAKPENLTNSHRIGVGLEYIPDISSYNSYLKKVRYRIGGFYYDDPRLDDLTNIGLTFGFGLPVILPRGQTSYVNLAFEVGTLGTSNSIKENYIKTTVGFTLNDNTWFFKRKFN